MFELSVSFSLFNKVCVLDANEKIVVFGMVNPEDEAVRKRLVKAVRSWFLEQMDGSYAGSGEELCQFEKVSEDILNKFISFKYGCEETRENPVDKKEKFESAEKAAALLLDSLLNQACDCGATDIHIEENLVRFRVTGKLRKICELSTEKSAELVRRIKVLSKLDVMECRRGQDGQFVFWNERPVCVRVSCVPAISAALSDENAFGTCESIVLRLLDPVRIPLHFEKLGFTERQCRLLRKLTGLSNGLILICGATGSGKSTTAASFLEEIMETENGQKKIISIEDPPEYVLPGITQLRVQENFGMGFTDALKYVFRQDPDVLFIGEIRDEKSAAAVIQAAGTGHLVIATVHASSIKESILRLTNLGVKADELETVLKAVVYQQLKCIEDSVRLLAELHVCDELQEKFYGKKV